MLTHPRYLCLFSDWERVAFTIAFTTIAFEKGLNNVEKGWVFAAFFYGSAFTQVSTCTMKCST